MFQSSFQGAHLFSQHSLQWAHNSLRIKVLDYRPLHICVCVYTHTHTHTHTLLSIKSLKFRLGSRSRWIPASRSRELCPSLHSHPCTPILFSAATGPLHRQFLLSNWNLFTLQTTDQVKTGKPSLILYTHPPSSHSTVAFSCLVLGQQCIISVIWFTFASFFIQLFTHSLRVVLWGFTTHWI